MPIREVSNNSIDTLSLGKYFYYGYVPSPSTLYKNIYKLEPGHSLLVSLTKKKIIFNKKYFNFVINSKNFITLKNEEYYKEKFYFLLSEAIRKRSVSDIKLGCFLSGGVDSSAVS